MIRHDDSRVLPEFVVQVGRIFRRSQSVCLACKSSGVQNRLTVSLGLYPHSLFFWMFHVTASPYLLSLGLSKSNMAIVFIAGPLSGLVMQPLIGAYPPNSTQPLSKYVPLLAGLLADNSSSRFGRRRPYMLLGTVTCIFAMLLLGFTRPAASIFTGWNNSAVSYISVVKNTCVMHSSEWPSDCVVCGAIRLFIWLLYQCG